MKSVYYSNSVNETHRIAERIFKRIKIPAFLTLNGDLGAGKTEFVRGIGKALDINNILSPTFTLIREYDTKPRLFHFDVYRLNSYDELTDIGFDDYLNAEDGLVVMEWSDRFKEFMPDKRLDIRITGSGDQPRELVISSECDYFTEVFK